MNRRALRGKRCNAPVPHGHWNTITFVGALCLDDVTAPMTLDGAINKVAIRNAVTPNDCASFFIDCRYEPERWKFVVEKRLLQRPDCSRRGGCMLNFSVQSLLVGCAPFASLGLTEDATTQASTGAARPATDNVSPKELKPYASKRNGLF